MYPVVEEYDVIEEYDVVETYDVVEVNEVIVEEVVDTEVEEVYTKTISVPAVATVTSTVSTVRTREVQ